MSSKYVVIAVLLLGISFVSARCVSAAAPLEGLYIFKTQKAKSLAVMKKNLRGASDEILEETYQVTIGEMEQIPTPSLQVIRSGLDILSLQYPQAKQTDPMPLFDPSFVRRIEQSGFLAALSMK